MDEKILLACCHFMKQHKKIQRLFYFTGKTLPVIVAWAYPLFLLWLWFIKSPYIFSAVFIPFITLMFVTLIRKIINRKRPFEVYPIIPPYAHEGGNSFPSRHTASAFIIAMVILPVNSPLGVGFFICAIIIGISRVMLGLHYPLDVVAGAAISILMDLVLQPLLTAF